MRGTYASPGRRLLERLDQRPRRERLCEIGDASGFHRGHANGGVVVRGDVDDRHGNSRSLETVPQFDPGLVVQVDIENDANRRFEIVVILKRLRRRKQDAVVTIVAAAAALPP